MMVVSDTVAKKLVDKLKVMDLEDDLKLEDERSVVGWKMLDVDPNGVAVFDTGGQKEEAEFLQKLLKTKKI